VKAGEVYNRQITAALVAIWTEELAGYSPAVLAPVFRNVLRACKFFPTPADVLEPLTRAVKRDNLSAADTAWRNLIAYVNRWIDPDMPGGKFRGAPEVPAEVDLAARAAGGMMYLRECSSTELPWRKKAFCEAFLRRRETAEHENLLTGGELSNLLRNLGKELPDSRP
jgi:hypothetical protein